MNGSYAAALRVRGFFPGTAASATNNSTAAWTNRAPMPRPC